MFLFLPIFPTDDVAEPKGGVVPQGSEEADTMSRAPDSGQANLCKDTSDHPLTLRSLLAETTTFARIAEPVPTVIILRSMEGR